jgi:hypothetical protein
VPETLASGDPKIGLTVIQRGDLPQRVVSFLIVAMERKHSYRPYHITFVSDDNSIMRRQATFLRSYLHSWVPLFQ